MKRWSTACTDWETKIVTKQSLIPCEPLYPEVAEIALETFKNLIVADIMGSPRMGDIMPQWVFDFVAVIFGSLDPEENRRLIKEFFLLISKKNAKSTIAAGIMMTAIILNDRESAELAILAPTKEVADNSFKPAKDMIRLDEDLAERFAYSEHTRTITDLSNRSTLKVLAADDKTVTGGKYSFLLIDEEHIFGSISNAESIFTEAKGGLLSRIDGFVIKLSTQSTKAPAGVFAQELNYARGVRDGRIQDNTYLPLIYEFPKAYLDDGSYKNPENFYITNPSLGYSVDEQTLLSDQKKAEEKGAEAYQEWCSKHLNVETGLNLRSNRWAGADFWEDTVINLTLDQLIARSEIIDIGIDGGGLDDLLGLSVLGRDKVTKEWLSWSHAWVHPIGLQRRKSEVPKYKDFEKQGDLTIVNRIGNDIEEVANIVNKVFKADLLDKIGVDRSGIGSIVEAIVDRGIDAELIVGVNQGWPLNGAIKVTERKIAEGTLQHADQPLMNWCVSNAKVEPRGNAILITKQASGTAKIDPLMALFNAVSLMSLNPEAKTKKYQMFFV